MLVSINPLVFADMQKARPNPGYLPQIDPNQRYEIEEALAYLRTSRTRLYEKISAGQIKTIMDGRRRYIPGSEIIRESQIPEAAAEC